MKTKLLTFMFLGFLFLISVSLAKDYEVSVGITPKIMTVHPCEIASFDIDVKNLGEVEDTYSVSIEGLPEGWYSLSEDSLTLGPGELDKIYLFVTPYCYGEFGAFKGSVVVTDQSNATDIFFLNVVPDHKIEVSLPEEVKTCLQETSNITATVKNTGNYTEELVLEVSGNASGFVELSKKSLTLNPGESKEISLSIKPTEESLGDYLLELEGKSTTSYATSKASSVIKVVDCYKVSVIYPEKVETCANELIQFNITLKNVGLKEDSYEVEIKDLNYTEIVKLEPEESQTLKMLFLKGEIGTYDVDFTVKSNFVEEEGTIEFVVLRCYGVDLSVEEKEFEIEMGRGKLIRAEVTNLGTKGDTFKITSDVGWVSIKPTEVTLASNESRDVFVYYSPKFGLVGTLNTSLTAKSDKSEDTENLKITITKVTIPTIETTTTTVPPSVEIPTVEIVGVWEKIMESRVIRSALIAVIIVIIILIVIYLVVMR